MSQKSLKLLIYTWWVRSPWNLIYVIAETLYIYTRWVGIPWNFIYILSESEVPRTLYTYLLVESIVFDSLIYLVSRKSLILFIYTRWFWSPWNFIFILGESEVPETLYILGESEVPETLYILGESEVPGILFLLLYLQEVLTHFIL